MAFGFTTHFETRISRETQSNWQILALAAEACKLLKWDYSVFDDTGLTAYTSSGWSQKGESVTISFEDDDVIIKSTSLGNVMRDGGRNKKNIEQKFVPEFLQARETTTGDQLTELANALQNKATTEAEEIRARVESGNLTAAEKIALGAGGHKVTYTLIALNVLVFGIMCIVGVSIFEPQSADLIKWGANYGIRTTGGEWWRLITSVFLHIGIVHLLFNMYALYVIGTYLEPILGRLKYAVAYISTGIFASLLSVFWGADRISAGASGAIFGMYGLFLALLTTNYIEKRTRNAMLQSIGIFVVYNLVYGMKAGVDNSAHLGGLISGFLIGYVYYTFDLKVNIPAKDNFKIPAAVAIVTVIAASAYLFSQKNDDLKFDNTLQKIIKVEDVAVGQMNRFKNYSSTTDLAKVIKDSTLPEWQSFKTLVDETKQYRLGEKMKKKRSLLSTYANLRLQQLELVYKAVTENTNSYDNQTSSITDQINKVINELGS